jgi:anti-sigma B factor antagonist
VWGTACWRRRCLGVTILLGATGHGLTAACRPRLSIFPGDDMDQFRRIQTGKKGDIFMVLFKDKKILDDTMLDEIRTEMTQLLGKASGPDVLLDFSNVEFMSSAMLGLLGQLHRKISAGQGRLKMCGIRPEIFQVFKLTNLDKLFSIHKDAPTALATFA